MRSKKFIAFAASISLVFCLALAMVPVGGATVAQSEKTYNCLSPQSDPPRVFFTGNLGDAQDFYQQTTLIDGSIPIAKYTDGMPIIIPTEEAVKEILTGTSHQPEEQLFSYTRSAAGQYTKSADPVKFGGTYTATVEQVAVIATMAGCKAEYLPVVLAGATAGGGFTDASAIGNIGYFYIVSGPIAKEIGMNAGHGALNVGNIANMTIGRTMNLISVNFARYVQGVTRNDAGHPFTGLSIAEDDTLLPEGWESLREEYGYGKDESALGKGAVGTSIVGTFAPSSFRSLVGEGQGGMAVRMGVSGPGKYNFLEYVASYLIEVYAHNYGWCIIMHGNMASSLKTYGFNSKAEVYDWLSKTYTITAEEYRKYGYYDVATQNGTAIEPISGKAYKDLPADHKLSVFGKKPTDNCIIVSVTPGDEVCWGIGCVPARPAIYPVDPWK